MSYEKKITELGINLPKAPKPVAEYIPAKKIGKIVLSSGQGPIKEDGEYLYVGKVGKDVNIEEAYQASRLCALNALAAIKTVVGSLDNIEEIVQVRGFVNSMNDFLDQPKVMNGASELMVEIFGEKGRHVRSALGTSVLPDDIPVEVELVVQVKDDWGVGIND